jgi:O-antigen/teichoic acid export membrane protein
MLGLGTLLIGELPRQPGREGSLLGAALLLAGTAGVGLGVLWALLAPAFSPALVPLGGGPAGVAVFALGVGLTSAVLVLDQALLGLLRGDLQLGRNVAFGLVKLALLTGLSLSLAGRQGLAIYVAWQVGNVVSLALLGAYAFRSRPRRTLPRPAWGLLHQVRSPAINHHLLNLSLQLPHLALPVIVTVLLSATVNAYFYMAWMIGGFVFVVPVALTMAVFALGARDPAVLAPKVRFTLKLAFGLGLLANAVLLVCARPLLSLFGPAYADQAEWCLRILGLGVFPLIVKDHYVAVRRVEGRIGRAALVAGAGAGLELGAAAAGALAGGLVGLSLAWVGALCFEAALLAFPVCRAAGWLPGPSSGVRRRGWDLALRLSPSE